jgi:proline iminopeptidase
MYIKVNRIHSLWYRSFGKTTNQLVIYLHGGPGGYHDLSIKKHVNLEKYRLLMYDQRGCGKSLPFLEIKKNTIESNVNDLKTLIDKFSNNMPVILIGDSYGTQLALLYSKKYPSSVAKMILTGLWYGGKKDIDNLYSIKATKYKNIFYSLFNTDKIDLKKQFNMIKKNQNIYNWLAWEWFLGQNNKKQLKNNILNEEILFKSSKEDKGIAFFESYFFSQKQYVNHKITINDIKKLASKIELYHGQFDEVCLPIPVKQFKQIGIKCKIIKNMGHMPSTNKEHAIIFKSIKKH